MPFPVEICFEFPPSRLFKNSVDCVEWTCWRVGWKEKTVKEENTETIEDKTEPVCIYFNNCHLFRFCKLISYRGHCLHVQMNPATRAGGYYVHHPPASPISCTHVHDAFDTRIEKRPLNLPNYLHFIFYYSFFEIV